MNDHDRNRFRFFIRPQTGAAPALPGRSPSAVNAQTAASPRPLAAASPGPAAAASLRQVPAALARATPTVRRPKPRHLRLAVMTRTERDDGTESGFSLLELLVVVAILGILVAAALPRFAEFRAAAYDSRSQQDLRNLAAAEELYRATSPTYADDAGLLSGFAASEGVEIALESADETGFVATASHPAGGRDFRWDSSADPPLSSAAR